MVWGKDRRLFSFTKYLVDVTSLEMLALFGKSDCVGVLLELQIQVQEDKQLEMLRILGFLKFCSFAKSHMWKNQRHRKWTTGRLLRETMWV